MKNGEHLLNSSMKTINTFDFLSSNDLCRFFQRMALFTLYFTICLLALLIRGYYRVPMSCIRNELLDKDEKTMKSIIEDRMECRCHYTNFFRLSYMDNQTVTNSSDEQQRLQSWGLVSHLSSFSCRRNIRSEFRFSIYWMV